MTKRGTVTLTGEQRRELGRRIERLDRVLDAIPSSWLDPLLTGSKAVIGQPPYSCQDIERLCNHIKDRIRMVVS